MSTFVRRKNPVLIVSLVVLVLMFSVILAPVPTVHASAGSNRLSSGETLYAGQSLISSSGINTLSMQTDGNLALYTYYGGWHAIWSSGTNGKGGVLAAMQTDGNFVVYNSTPKPLWWSGTVGHSGAFLSLQDDGNAVIYSTTSSLWATHTNIVPTIAYNANACMPKPVISYYQGEINNLVQATNGICTSVLPYGTYKQTSGWTTVNGGSAWFYVQHNPDGYTQLQLSGPSYWWAYWQQNPPDPNHGGCSWYQEQVNTWSGGPYYFDTGWKC